MAADKPGVTWFILVNGGEDRAEDEKTARQELKTIYRTVLEQKLADSDHVIFLSGSKGKLDPTFTLQHSQTVKADRLETCVDSERHEYQRFGISEKDNG